jgi:hypothetical protein
MNNSTTLWQDAHGRTVADKTAIGTFLSYEEFDKEARIWVPVQRVAIPTDQYKTFANFLTKK